MGIGPRTAAFKKYLYAGEGSQILSHPWCHGRCAHDFIGHCRDFLKLDPLGPGTKRRAELRRALSRPPQTNAFFWVIMTQHTMKPIYHYTTASRLEAILKTGMIKPATAGVPKSETPAVWLSSTPGWERTANKGIVKNGISRTATVAEMIEAEGYLARIQIDPSREIVIAKKDLKSNLNISTNMYNMLIKTGRKMGSKPEDWAAVAGKIPTTSFLRIELAYSSGPISWVDSGWSGGRLPQINLANTQPKLERAPTEEEKVLARYRELMSGEFSPEQISLFSKCLKGCISTSIPLLIKKSGADG
jgi:hypothetical protein